jgi:hypothetical protein
MKTTLLSTVAAFAACLTAGADVTTTFGTLSGATFASHSVASNAVEITTITDLPGSPSDTVVLGLSATPRGALAPLLSNNGAGAFVAQAGTANGGALWDLDFYIGVANSDFANYSFTLRYGPEGSPLVSYTGLATIPDNSGAPTSAQNSENLSFPFLGAAIAFNPDALATYDFDLVAYNAAGTELGTSDITVTTRSVADSASTLVLLALVLPGLALVKRFTTA